MRMYIVAYVCVSVCYAHIYKVQLAQTYVSVCVCTSFRSRPATVEPCNLLAHLQCEFTSRLLTHTRAQTFSLANPFTMSTFRYSAAKLFSSYRYWLQLWFGVAFVALAAF